MHRLKFVLAGLLFASPAFAQGEGEMPPDPNVGGEYGAEGELGGEMTEATPPPEGGEMAAATTGMAWSRSLIDRPYTVAKGKIGAYADFSIVRFSFADPTGMISISGTGDALGIGAGYGVTDKINVGAQYQVTLGLFDSDTEFKGPLSLFGLYQLVHDGKLSVTASGDFTVDLCGARDLMGDCDTALSINAGLGAKYLLGPKMALYTGAPVGPGPIGRHLSVSLESGGPITLDIPVGFMYQATPELNVQAETNLATIGISNADSSFFGVDVIPLGIGALYSVTPNIDVVGRFVLPDLKDAGFDLLVFSIGARYYN